MKPLLSAQEDQDSLQTLGRASVQIVHDLKNQLNGLKLYATFLRKRMERSEQREDEQETVAKLIAGLERAASDLSTLVQFGRPIELKKQPGVDLQKIMRGVVTGLSVTGVTGALNGLFAIESTEAALAGDFDPVRLADALKAISVGALKARNQGDAMRPLQIHMNRELSQGQAQIEWRGLSFDHDPFASFAGSDEIRMSLAAKIITAHGGSAKHESDALRVFLPITA